MSYKGPLTLHVKECIQARYSFIFLHGYDCSGKDNTDFFSWSHANTTTYPELRVVCPDAPLLKTSAPGYEKEAVHSWYDFFDGECNSADDKPDLNSLRASCNEIHDIIQSEGNLVGLENVFVGGVSQGCCAAFHAVATCPTGPIGGFYGSIGHVMPCTPIENLKNTVHGPIIFYCGTDDEVYPFSLIKPTLERLEGIEKVEIWLEDGTHHCDDGRWTAQFLSRVIPPPTLRDQIIACEKKMTNRDELKCVQ